MSLHLPGNRGAFAPLLTAAKSITRVVALALVLVAAPYAWADTVNDGSESASGKSEPVVTILTPTIGQESPYMVYYNLPKKYSTPFGLTIAKDGIIWFTEMSIHTLSRLDPVTNELRQYRIPSTVGLKEVGWIYDPSERSMPDETVTNYSVGSPGAVITDHEGSVWFVQQLGNAITRFDPKTEVFTEYISPTPNAQPYDLAADSKGRIWFVEKNSGALGYLDVANKKLLYVNFGKQANLMGVAVDDEDMVWVADATENFIARYNLEKKSLRKFPINAESPQPGMMRFGKNGYLWVCYLRARQLGVFMTKDKGIQSVVQLPGYNTVPQALGIGQDGKVWIVDSMTNKIGWFDPESLRWNLVNIPTTNAQPMNIAIDKNGDAWFTQSGREANRLAKVVTKTMVPEEQAAASDSPHGAVTGESTTDGSEGSLPLTILVIVAALAAGGLVIRRFWVK